MAGGGVTAFDPLDLYDHEIIAIEKVMNKLKLKQATLRNYNDLEREIKERFAEIGLVVQVGWHRYSVGGVEQPGAMPEITPIGRTDTAFKFDPDRQVHEVTNNILEIPGEEGVIKTDDSDVFRNFRQEHGHGHQHSHGHPNSH